MKKVNYRAFAESLWGAGGTRSVRTNTKGAYYYNCRSHGGYIIDGRILDDSQKKRLEQYVKPAGNVTLFKKNGKVRAIHHSWKTQATIYPIGCEEESFDIYALEEDCAWCLAKIILNIGPKHGNPIEYGEQARECFYIWFDPRNPVVLHRNEVKNARRNKSHDLIVSASRFDDEHTDVYTADDCQFRVTGYDTARDEYNTPWLHLCDSIEALYIPPRDNQLH